MVITNSNSESSSLWKMSLWIFTSTMVCSPAVNSTFEFFKVFMMQLMTLPDILYIFRHSVIQVCRWILYAFFNQSISWVHFSTLFCPPRRCADLYILGHRNSQRHSNKYFTSFICVVTISLMIGKQVIGQ